MRKLNVLKRQEETTMRKLKSIARLSILSLEKLENTLLNQED
jgi:hypothetical protein